MQIKTRATVTLLFATVLFDACGVAPTTTVNPEVTSDLPQAPPISTAVPQPPAPPVPPVTATEAAISTPTPSPAPESSDEPMLKMVLIKARSSQEVEQLRKLHLDIVRVRSVDPEEAPAQEEKAALVGEFIVEAVVPTEMLSKLKNLGFELTEVPQ